VRGEVGLRFLPLSALRSVGPTTIKLNAFAIAAIAASAAIMKYLAFFMRHHC
jgi:hypothetical protein